MSEPATIPCFACLETPGRNVWGRIGERSSSECCECGGRGFRTLCVCNCDDAPAFVAPGHEFCAACEADMEKETT